jgi:hypothetical protein
MTLEMLIAVDVPDIVANIERGGFGNDEGFLEFKNPDPNHDRRRAFLTNYVAHSKEQALKKQPLTLAMMDSSSASFRAPYAGAFS